MSQSTSPRIGPPTTTVVCFVLMSLLTTSVAAGELWTEASSHRLETPSSPYAELVKQTEPAVISLLVSYDDDDLPPHAREVLPHSTPDPMGEGSGFIINPEGYILTNYHVIDDANSITVRLVDDTEYQGRVVGGDPMTDIALLKVDADEPLPTLPLGDSSTVDVGDYVVAIGHPLGLSHSVTAGIVSALDRRDLPIEGREHQGNFMQVDAPINPGNSGGPLLNMEGEVVGMNTAVNRRGQGISFAIPVDLLKTLVPQLDQKGYVDRSWLGVRIQQLDPVLARSFDLNDPNGALVTEVIDDSPASRAGIQQRDIIIGVDDIAIEASDELPLRVSTAPAGSTITLRLIRDGETELADVELESLPDQTRPELPEIDPVNDASHHPAGLEVEAMTEQYSRQLDAPDNAGVVVTSLEENSPARHAGVRDRDVIVKIGSRSIDSEHDFHEALEAVPEGSVVRFELLRDGRTVYKAFTR